MSTATKRWKYGDTSPVIIPFPLGTAFNEGDFMYVDTSNVTPPDNQTQLRGLPAGSLAVASALADPTVAPTVSANATPLGPGFTVAGAGFKVAYTYVTVDGLETGASPLSAAMNTNGNGINSQIPAAIPAGVRFVNWYVTTDGGAAGTLKLAAQTLGGFGLVISGPPASDAPAPPAASALTATVMSQIAFAKLFLGVAAQTYGGENPLTTYGIKNQYARVLTEGVFDFACASANWNDGDLIGIALVSGGATYDPQGVVAVPQSQFACAFARCVKGGTSLTTVRGKLFGSKARVAHLY